MTALINEVRTKTFAPEEIRLYLRTDSYRLQLFSGTQEGAVIANYEDVVVIQYEVLRTLSIRVLSRKWYIKYYENTTERNLIRTL